jgi:threonine/homoserine/homoserine lactone efflux protein
MVALIGIAVGSFVLALSGALVPGPMFSATVAGSHRCGFWFGPMVVAGHAVAEAVMVALILAALALAGLRSLMESPWVLVGITIVGVPTMVWMGIGLLRQSRRPVDVAGDAGVLKFGAVPTGILTSVLNPYWYFWWVTQGPLLVASAAEMGWSGVGAFFAGHISADLSWYSLMALGVSRGRRLLAGKVYTGLLMGCAAILFIMAALFLKLALEKVLGA